MRKSRTKLDGSERDELALLERLVRQLPRERRVFTSQALGFLMVGHYLVGRWSLSQGLAVLLEGGARKFLGRCKRVDTGNHSFNTSGLSQARGRLSIEPLRQIWGILLSELKEEVLEWHGRKVKTIDGSSELLQPIASLRHAFPPTKNQFGESAYPIVQLTVLHDAFSGVAEDYEFGALNGDSGQSELEQSHRLLSRLQPGTVVIADRGHGIRQMVKRAQEMKLDVVYRLKESIAKKLCKEELKPEMDRVVEWVPSKAELKAHPDWKAGEIIRGRVITKEIVRDEKTLFLALFTTLDQSFPASELVELYGHRWEIETEIRDLKRTIGLSRISSRSPAMIEKEIVAAIVAYNIVRAAILAAAKKHGIQDIKRISFKGAYDVIQNATWRLLEARTAAERQHIMDRAFVWIAARINHKRPGRSFPRKAYKPHAKYPSKRPSEDGVWG